RKNIVLKLVACIPFIANCENPDRIALAHMGTYIMADNPACKENFSHNTFDNENIMKRLMLGSTFMGGIKSIIDRGMNLLALAQLEDHKKDLTIDQNEGKYNPILVGAWNYNTSKKQLLTAINGVPCPDMDAVIPPAEVQGYWTNGEG
ncbi:MAG: hypothetical protein GY760_08595, partial [Deltaproteobacteria bacterium]|nr:hypothetical protein [Deltaproteobacteria bacterium]